MTIGHSYAEAALWEDAAAAFARAVKHSPRDRLAAIYRASTLAILGDREALKAQCATMLDEFAAASDPSFANRLTRWCDLVPGCAPDPARMVNLATKAVAAGRPDPLLRFHLALADYRAGQFDEAIRQASQSLAAVPAGDPALLGAFNEALMAMAHHRIGQAEAARRRLGSVARLDWEAIERQTEPQDWWIRADFLTLKREAVATVTGQPAPEGTGLIRRRAQALAQLGRSAEARP